MSANDIFAWCIAFHFSAVQYEVFFEEVGRGNWQESEFLNIADGDKFDVYCMYQFLFIRSKPLEDVKPKEFDWWLRRLVVTDESIDEEIVEQEMLKTNPWF